MKNKELKTLWKLAKSIWIAAIVFWIFETIIFLIIDGWHIKATNPIEIYCDKIVLNMIQFALTLTLITCVEFLVNFNRKRKSKNLT